MTYYVFKLRFQTPVHFGNAQNGGGLEEVVPTCRADTFFSALCNEAAQAGEGFVQKLVTAAQEDKLIISDLMPFWDDGQECSLFVPKPVLALSPTNELHSLKQVRQDATARKRQKKTNFMRAGELKTYLQNLKEGRVVLATLPALTEPYLLPKVNCRGQEPLPYLVGAYRFFEDCKQKQLAGLYFVAGVDDALDVERLSSLVNSLGLTGLGGKRSSGYGKFSMAEDLLELDEAGIYKDDAALYAMLKSEDSRYYMNLSTVVPQAGEIETVKKGSYKLINRSGFIASTSWGEARKRDAVCALEAGSCFDKRLQGQVLALEAKDCPHPVYRYGKGMFAGLPL